MMHVLFVDDNEVNRFLAVKIFQRLGCSIATANNGQHALEYLSGPFPRPDIIFMDISMPIMDGIEATRIIRTQPPFSTDPQVQRTPIIGLTASAIGIGLGEDKMFGFNDFMRKPMKVSAARSQLRFWTRKEIMPPYAGVGASSGFMVGIQRRHRGPRSRI
ncbi:CheY-like protein [Aspergillus ellipticus CBS 707.79]|uniref:CheY-like protein n=1 Tax=Aspergillus ellipticus CBS 707.79 TaxID=1448320 RepID=A0A319DB74_9EURO|nr:CheY-like protein [Aspergillus ellipticus CBS 707.79]